MEMSTRNPMTKATGSKKKEDNIFAAPNKDDEDTLRRFQKMQVAKAFSSKSSGDQKLAGALAFLKKRSSQIKKKKKVRTGIHSTLEVIRRSSVASLEELRKDEMHRRERQKKLEEAKKRKKEKMAKGGLKPANDDDDDDDDESHLAIIPPLFPEAFLFSENYGYFKRTWTIVVLLLVCYTTIMIPLDFAFPNMNEDDQIGQDAFSAFGYVVDAIFIIDVIAKRAFTEERHFKDEFERRT